MLKSNKFTTPGGIQKFLETSGIAEDVSHLNIRQVIKRKNQAKKSLETYNLLFSNWKKRLDYQRYMKATILLCNDIQKKRRQQAVDYYYSLPKDERTPKNWIKYTSMFSSFRQSTKGQDIHLNEIPNDK
jgi:hypothetical protein